MRPPRVRFKMTSMMVIVAVVALSIWATLQVNARRTYFSQLVTHYREKKYAAESYVYSGPGGEIMKKRLKADEVRRTKASLYYAKLIENYERASRYPWLPVDPNPPKPEGIDDNRIIVE